MWQSDDQQQQQQQLKTMQRRRGLPAFFDNDTPASAHGTLTLPYPAPETSAMQQQSLGYAFDSRRDSETWANLTRQRHQLCACFRDGNILRVPLDRAFASLVDAYASELFTLLSSSALPHMGTTQQQPPVFVWRSSCDGLDYISASLHFECFMAQLLAYIVHFNRLAAWRLTTLELWEREVQPSETLEACRTRLACWPDSCRRDAAIQFMLTASARRCHASLEAWRELSAYTALRYPIELSREFVELLLALDTAWQQVDRHEASVAGILILDDSNGEHWISPGGGGEAAVTTGSQLVALTVRLAALARAFQPAPRWREHASTLATLSEHCERSALYALTYENVAAEFYEEAYACVLALLDSGGDGGDDVIVHTTLAALRAQVLAAAALTNLRTNRPTQELSCAEVAARAVVALYERCQN